MSIKSQKGAITLYVLVSMLVFTMLAVGLFVTSANKQRAQLEAIEQTKKVYDSDETAEEAYQKYIGGDVIPIYTAEQFQKIGTGSNITINGKIYTFATGKTYVLKNNINLSEDFSEIRTLLQNGSVTLEGQGYKVKVTKDGVSSVYTGSDNYQSPT